MFNLVEGKIFIYKIMYKLLEFHKYLPIIILIKCFYFMSATSMAVNS